MTTYPDITGSLTTTRHDLALGQHYVTWGWSGGPTVCLTDRILRHTGDTRRWLKAGDVITVGPYRLRCIERAEWMAGGAGYYMRDGWKALAYANWYRLVHVGEWFTARLWLTLAIWGLATYSEFDIPGWRDLKIVKWWNRRPTKRA